MDWKGSINIDFLEKGKKYLATVYEDDERESIRKKTVEVKKAMSFRLRLKQPQDRQ